MIFCNPGINFVDAENALGGVQQDAVRFEFNEAGVHVLVVFLGGRGG
jgi:hypothetical protein